MFEKVKIIRPKRSVFRLSYNNRTTQCIGEVVPSMAKLLMPGDTFKFGQVATVELQPMISPAKGDLWLESCAFFVPLDILALDGEEKFTDILVGQTDYQKAIPVPVWDLDKTNVDSDSKLVATHYNTLWDKFGFPLNLPATIDDEVTPIAYLQRGYNSIYNEWIRDENSDSEVPLTSNAIQTCCYKKDYFTSVFDSPQHGDAPTLPLTGQASAVWSSDILNTLIGVIVNAVQMRNASSSQSPAYQKVAQNTELEATLASGTSSPTPVELKTTSASGSGNQSFSKLNLKVDQAVLDLLNDNQIDLSDLITFNIDDLRLLNKLQKWLERTQLCGTRTKEFLLANYGLAPNDETLQRPVFLGRLRTPIQISSNLSSVETATLPQGHKSGNGVGQNSVLFKKWTCKEPGIIYVVSFVRPKATYQQGISREWIMRDIFDYPNPIFQDLGQQAVLNAEIYCQGTSDDKEIAGYQENYVHFKTSNDINTGRLRIKSSGSDPTLETWSIQRKFGSLPDLTSTKFLHVDPKDYAYLFNYQFEDAPTNNIPAPQMVITYSNVIKAIRPLHKRAMPSL